MSPAVVAVVAAAAAAAVAAVVVAVTSYTCPVLQQSSADQRRLYCPCALVASERSPACTLSFHQGAVIHSS